MAGARGTVAAWLDSHYIGKARRLPTQGGNPTHLTRRGAMPRKKAERASRGATQGRTGRI